jgi:hypothetical protein
MFVSVAAPENSLSQEKILLCSKTIRPQERAEILNISKNFKNEYK